ncbi:hypothetical protein LTR08_006400 [Meristemomyces frigidus]|nr:hypothetical protein LTR08_006400 [Meristemomyces frigidus]
MKLSITLAAASMAAFAAAAATKTVKRADSCAQWDTVETGTYTVYNNLWGESAASSGSGCLGVSGLTGTSVSWHSTWSWAGGVNNVKSYPNAVVKFTPKKLSAVSSMHSTFDWSYSGTSVVADVSYDMFTSSSATGSNEYEIMIWLAALGGAGPISSTYGADGKPTAIATVTIAGTKWSLYKGPNGSTTVYSFVASSEVAKFSGDVKAFFTYLVSSQGLSSSQYLTSVGAGTEPFTGSNAEFKVSAYSMAVK